MPDALRSEESRRGVRGEAGGEAGRGHRRVCFSDAMQKMERSGVCRVALVLIFFRLGESDRRPSRMHAGIVRALASVS